MRLTAVAIVASLASHVLADGYPNVSLDQATYYSDTDYLNIHEFCHAAA